MKTSIHLERKGTAVAATVATIMFASVLVNIASSQTANTTPPPASNAAPPEASVELEQSQLAAIKIEAVGTHVFTVERTALGSIDYDEDLAVQVFSSYQGKIITAFANLGDEVQKGQPLYTIDSPDLIQAESTLIGAAATFDLTSKELARAKDLYGTNGVSEREMEQATSDQQTAEGALKAARDAVRVFGKTEAEIDQIVATRKIDPALVVPSPVSGRGHRAQRATGPAGAAGQRAGALLGRRSFDQVDGGQCHRKRQPALSRGQPVEAKVMAFPGRVFDGKISALGAAVDPNTHRVMVRCEMPTPK